MDGLMEAGGEGGRGGQSAHRHDHDLAGLLMTCRRDQTAFFPLPTSHFPNPDRCNAAEGRSTSASNSFVLSSSGFRLNVFLVEGNGA